MIDLLRDTLPPRFAIDKGKLIDSDGRMSKEFDIVIYEKNECFTAMKISGRIIIPIEAVYGMIEVKSFLNKENYVDSIEKFKSISGFTRHFVKHIFDGDRKLIPSDKIQSKPDKPPIIWSMIIGFDGVQSKTLSKYLEEIQPPDFLLEICIANRELIMKWMNPRGFKGILLDDLSAGFMLWSILDFLNANRRPAYLFPDYRIYTNKIVDSIGPMKVWNHVEKG